MFCSFCLRVVNWHTNREIFSFQFFWKSIKTFCKFLGIRNIVRNKRIGLNCLCCRADRRGIQHFFCSLCPMVVNGLTTRRDFNKTTKYRRFWREITPLGQRLQKKCYIPWQSAWQDEDFGTLHLMRTTFLMPKNLPNTLVDFQDFQKNYLLTKLKIT